MMIFLIILVMEPEEEEISLTLKRDTGQKWGFAFAGKVRDYFKRYFINFPHSSLSIKKSSSDYFLGAVK